MAAIPGQREEVLITAYHYLTPSLLYLLTPYYLTPSLPHSLTPSLPHSLTASLPLSLSPHCLTPSLPHPLTASLPHSLTASPAVLVEVAVFVGVLECWLLYAARLPCFPAVSPPTHAWGSSVHGFCLLTLLMTFSSCRVS